MTLLMAAVLALAGDDPFDLPSIGDLAWQDRREPVQTVGVEAFALWTQFDSGLFIQEEAGLGLDVNFRWKPRGKVAFGFSLGYAGWNTENDDSERPPASVEVRQYRAGFGVEFPFRFMEFGLGSTVGVYRFRSDLDDDSSPFFELEGTLAYVPHPMFRAGLLGVASHTQSSFNHDKTHLYHNYSIGVFAEIRF